MLALTFLFDSFIKETASIVVICSSVTVNSDIL